MICRCDGFIGNLPPGQGGGGGGGGAPTNRIYLMAADVRSVGTDAGTFTSSAWQTRIIDTTQASNGTDITRSGNQITMQPGAKYRVIARAPARMVDSHKLKLRNITDSTDDIIGNAALSRAAGNETNMAFLSGEIDLTAAGAAKTFELQHRCNTTRSTDGFGLAYNVGVDEVYAQIYVEKIYDPANEGTVLISEHYFDVSKTGLAQTLPDNTLTQIDGFSENWDTGNDFAANTYTTPSNGIYTFNLSMEVVMGSAAGIWELMITTGSSPLVTAGGYAPASASLWLHVSTGPIYRTSGNLIRAYAFQNTGQSCNIQTGGNFRGAQLWAGTLSGGS